ncbi:MAG: hypothetical protein IJY74_02210 [Oscillospiraceae bacterium]|nr:hypothetical protein [Oscillospiraceae bacterium]
MARAKTEKKLLCFTDLDLMNRILKDRAEVENRSESSIVEQFLLGSMLSWHSKVREILIKHLYAENGDVKRTLTHLLMYLKLNRYGIETHYKTLSPLVLFAFYNSIKSSDENNKNFAELTDEKQRIILSLIRDAVQELETCNEDKAAAGVRLLRQFDEFPNSYGVREIYLFLLEHIDPLDELSMTYDLLIHLAELGEWSNDCQTRLELVDAMNKVVGITQFERNERTNYHG